MISYNVNFVYNTQGDEMNSCTLRLKLQVVTIEENQRINEQTQHVPSKAKSHCIASRSPKGTVNTCVVNCYKWQVVYGMRVVASLRVEK